MVKKIKGVEFVTEHEINCNSDVVKLWREELDEQKLKLESPDTDRHLLANNEKEFKRVDAYYED